MEFRRPGRLAIGDLLRGLQRTLVLELGGHASRAESVIADPNLDAGVGRASHHYAKRRMAFTYAIGV